MQKNACVPAPEQYFVLVSEELLSSWSKNMCVLVQGGHPFPVQEKGNHPVQEQDVSLDAVKLYQNTN